MPATLLDGKALAEQIQREITTRAADLLRSHSIRPGLAAVLVGDDPASQIYVRNKRRAFEKCGLASWLHQLPAETSQGDLVRLIESLNADAKVHGILVQLPLPSHIDENSIIRSVSPLKDVDGFGPENLGLLTAGQPRFLPCTPAGIQQILIRNDIRIEGTHVVIVGRSTIVGKPLALLLLHKGPGSDATVTVAHSRSRNLAGLTRQADIIVMAIGRAGFLSGDMVKPGAIVIDVGTNRLADGSWMGDVDFPAVREVASRITPVPGGVGPMTITMLLQNTLNAALLQHTIS